MSNLSLDELERRVVQLEHAVFHAPGSNDDELEVSYNYLTKASLRRCTTQRVQMNLEPMTATLDSIANAAPEHETLEQQFRNLVNEWLESYDRLSSDPSDWVLALPYQQIIALGKPAIPLLLRELRQCPQHWFWALQVLSGENPVSPEDAGRFPAMVAAWLAWGKARGYLDEP